MNQLCVWDLTIPESKISKNDLKDILKANCKKWCYQVEVGSQTGYIHYQCRVSLNKKLRKTELIQTELGSLGHVSPTSKEASLKANFYNYCTKDFTRTAGPWKDSDEDKLRTKQLELFESFELRPFQKDIVNWSTIFDMRSIDIIFDEVGNLGKSIFGEWMEYCDLAEEIPPFRLMDDIFQWVYGRPKKSCYFIDMPRGMKKDKLADFYSGIEIIKNGVAYDKRYCAKKCRFNRPRIFVFTNELPNFSLMSRDRWNVWRTTEDYRLIPYVEDNTDCLVD